MLQINHILGVIVRNKKLALYLHLVWATWNRSPLISPIIEKPIYRTISSQVLQLGCKVIAINGMPDHLHLIIKFPTTISIAEIVKKAKDVSSWFINKKFEFNEPFKWQAGYGAFTISRWDLQRIIQYVADQKHHHSDGLIDMDLEFISKK